MLVATRDALQNKTIWVANMHKKSEQYKYAKIPEIYQKNFWEIRTFPSTFPRKRRVYPTFSTTDIYVRIAKSPSMYLERLGIRWDGLQNWVIWAKSLSKCSSFRSQIPIRHISKRLEKGSTLINHPRLTLWYSSNLGESFCEVDFEQIYMNYNYSTFCPLHSCFFLIGVGIHIFQFMHPEF